jgi:RES domain-containing protein
MAIGGDTPPVRAAPDALAVKEAFAKSPPNEALPLDEFLTEDLAKLSVTLAIATRLHRARPGFKPGEYGEREAYKGDDIGAPPTAKAKAGRVNVDGQRVFYCADQEATAVSEVRPPRGFYVSVASVAVNREVRILDLAKGPPGINPFITETLRWDVEIQSLLIAFGEEMSLPLERDDDPAHYRPCQRLADYIRDARYDGIRYPSALNPNGTNVVFFDPTVVTIGESKLVKITQNTLRYEDERPPQPLIPRVAVAAPEGND